MYSRRDSNSRPSPRHLILGYDELIQNPEGAIRNFYEQFGYPDQPTLDKIVTEAIAETLAYKSDHVYSYEEMGFTRQQIIELYAEVFERFDFDKREPMLSKAEQVSELHSPAD